MSINFNIDDFFVIVVIKFDSGVLCGDYSQVDVNYVVVQNWEGYMFVQYVLWCCFYECQVKLILGCVCDVFIDSFKVFDVL